MPSTSVPFSYKAVLAGEWEFYHDDDCGATLVLDNGGWLCPACGFHPDFQSKKSARRVIKAQSISS